ncbi:TetR/AcrR family transcriptional regulator [uncultured Algibacter sp.]|uniref:TetR/AcrR family transcriptional regulator n=1 Tax=uncultured Algibacter sp. TaxID=298659 RepID=UPI00260A89CB|nr:TetR/AcrR family transcriptional regulator [uncultured Algibacter sp.]
MKHNLNNILQTGTDLFQKKGYTGTGTDEILKSGNYPRSSFYYHFKNKEGFAIKVLERYGENSQHFYSSILLNKQGGNSAERLEKFVSIIADSSENKNFESECLIQKFATECAGINTNLKDTTKVQLDKLLSITSECIQQGQNEGFFHKKATSIDLAKKFQAILYGSFIQARLNNSADIMIQLLNDEIQKLKA